MEDARCPCCGSRDLVWDHVSGDIVCSRCGCVVGRIYEAGLSTRAEPSRHARRSRRSIEGYRRTRILLGVLRRVRPGYVIDNDALKLYVKDARRHARIFVRRDTPIILEALASENPCVERILGRIDDYPRLSARTMRVKLAIAYYACMAAGGRPPSPKQLASRTGVNQKYIEGVLKWARRTHLIRELVETIIGEGLGNGEEEHHKKRADTRAVERG